VTVTPSIGAPGSAYLIRSYAVPLNEVRPAPWSHQWSITDAALATTANPDLFPPHTIMNDGLTYGYQDVSLSGYSNPSVLAHKEATRLFSDKQLNVLLSIGPGQRALIRKEDESRTYVVMDHLKEVASGAEKAHEDLIKALDDL
jgi:hypothetical protein